MTDADRDSRDLMKPQTITKADVKGNPLAPASLDQAMDLANMLAKSDIVPRDLKGKPANVLLVIMHGAEVGLSPAQALSSVFVVDGKPQLFGDGFLAVIMSHPEYYGRKEWFTDHEDNPVKGQAHRATVVFFRQCRDGRVQQYRASFSLEEAQQAGLMGKTNWVKYPDRMLLWRARTYAGQDGFPEALKGMVGRGARNPYADVFASDIDTEREPFVNDAPPDEFEPLAITCNCIDAAGFAAHDCPICDGAGEYIDPRTLPAPIDGIYCSCTEFEGRALPDCQLCGGAGIFKPAEALQDLEAAAPLCPVCGEKPARLIWFGKGEAPPDETKPPTVLSCEECNARAAKADA